MFLLSELDPAFLFNDVSRTVFEDINNVINIYSSDIHIFKVDIHSFSIFIHR